jgi:hypothetical protein
MTAPKTAQVEAPPPKSEAPATEATDNRLVDTWELLYQVDDKGSEEVPKESTRTLIEFTRRGQVIFNRVDPKKAGSLKSRSGTYSLADNEIRITDDVGNSVRWPYKITGDRLVIMMPKAKKKFFLRRFR